jgi:microcin C transport system substrate-binding protein
MEYPDDYSWVVFYLRKFARWHDGTPLTAHDIVFTFNEITKNNPFYRNYYKQVSKAEAIDDHTVKFTFDGEISRELPLIIGQMNIIPKHYWQSRDLSKSTLEPPVTSGPYKVTSFEAGKTVVIERVKDYWGKDLPVNIGQNNFERIVFEYFRDQTVAFEAFKAGHFDFTAESPNSRWYRGYTGKYFDLGFIIKEEIPHKDPEGLQGIAFNTSVKPLDDILVRQALNYAFDFDWINKNIYFSGLIRHNSFFSNSELACEPIPSPEVQKIIRQVKPDFPEELLVKPILLPQTDGSGNNRENLKIATELFAKAGYKVSGGKLVDKSGKSLKLEILTSSKVLEDELLNYQKALNRIGIDFYIRYLDSSQYVERIRNKDYMMIYTNIRQSESPGNEQRNLWGSVSADEIGSRNYAKIKDPAIDKLIDLIISAPDRKSLVNYTKALDRILLAGWYFIPDGYTDRYRIAYWDKFEKPEKQPEYDIAIGSWWISEAKEKKIDATVTK